MQVHYEHWNFTVYYFLKIYLEAEAQLGDDLVYLHYSVALNLNWIFDICNFGVESQISETELAIQKLSPVDFSQSNHHYFYKNKTIFKNDIIMMTKKYLV